MNKLMIGVSGLGVLHTEKVAEKVRARGLAFNMTMQAFARNCRNQCSDGKGEAQAAKTARREYRGGALGRTDSQ